MPDLPEVHHCPHAGGPNYKGDCYRCGAEAERARIADECEELARRIDAGVVTAPPARILRDLAGDLRVRGEQWPFGKDVSA